MTCPISRTQSTTESGQSRASRNAPVASAQTGCSPIVIGTVRFDRRPMRRQYSLSRAASSGSSSDEVDADGLPTDELRVVPG